MTTETTAGGLLDRRLVVVTGKGGVGKSTVAAALGLVAARRGLRAIVAEVARRSDVTGSFGHEDAEPFEEVRIRRGLHHISIDPQDAMEEYLRDQLGIGVLADVLVSGRMFGLLAAATPGLRELLTMGKLWELAQDERRTPGARPYDVVIADAPATGHALALLDAPRTFADAARGGPIQRQGRTIQAMLADPSRTAVVAVTKAEELPVSETGALRSDLGARLGLDLALVVANALHTDRLTAAEAERLRAGVDGVAVRRALAGHATVRRQRAQVERLRELTGRQEVALPLLVGGADVAALADRLEEVV